MKLQVNARSQVLEPDRVLGTGYGWVVDRSVWPALLSCIGSCLLSWAFVPFRGRWRRALHCGPLRICSVLASY